MVPNSSSGSFCFRRGHEREAPCLLLRPDEPHLVLLGIPIARPADVELRLVAGQPREGEPALPAPAGDGLPRNHGAVDAGSGIGVGAQQDLGPHVFVPPAERRVHEAILARFSSGSMPTKSKKDSVALRAPRSPACGLRGNPPRPRPATSSAAARIPLTMPNALAQNSNAPASPPQRCLAFSGINVRLRSEWGFGFFGLRAS